MNTDGSPPIVRLLFGLSVPLCLGMAYWGATYWVPRVGAPGAVWLAVLVGIGLHNAYVAATGRRPFARPGRRGGD